MGADEVFAPDSPEVADLAKSRGKPFDVVIDAVGNPAITNAALPLIKMGGTIGVYGVIADPAMAIQKSAGPYNFNLIVHQWPTRWRERQAQEPLCDWLRQGRIDPREFITHDMPLERINEALEQVRNGSVLKALLRY